MQGQPCVCCGYLTAGEVPRTGEGHVGFMQPTAGFIMSRMTRHNLRGRDTLKVLLGSAYGGILPRRCVWAFIGPFVACLLLWTRLVATSEYRTPRAIQTDGQSRSEKPGSGQQSCRAPDSFLNLIIKLRRDGPPQVLKATQVAGRLIVREEPPSSYIYEFRKDDKTISVGFLPEDPFTVRGFADPTNSRQETLGRAKSPTIILNVPHTNLASASGGRIGLRLYRLKSGASIETISAATLESLRVRDRVSLQLEVPPATFGAAISESLKKTQ
jgi:hypothetical protein